VFHGNCERHRRQYGDSPQAQAIVANDRIAVLAATPLEASSAKRELAAIPVYETGIALSRYDGAGIGMAISCGLAGGLRDDVPSGAVLIPSEVVSMNEKRRRCDPGTVQALSDAARSLGIEPLSEPMLTADTIVRGAERMRWAQRGYCGVDMESAAIRADSLAVVRVVLDTPQQELSADWERPFSAIMRPWNWPQAVWLARFAPGYARLAAKIVHTALAGR
jgi:hypothetical protein